jgi:AraC-like DNA-binding protein
MIAIIGHALGASFSETTTWSARALHATSVLVALEGALTIETEAGTRRTRAVVVPPHVLHRVTAEGPTFHAIYDADAFDRGIVDEARACEVVASHAHEIGRASVLDGVARSVAGIVRVARPVDRRVARVRELLLDPTTERRALVAASGLSEAHLQALFVRDVGVPIRTYRLWQRTVRAVLALRDRDATTAAHDVGFADHAHFTRTCRRMLGVPPSAMQAALRSAR